MRLLLSAIILVHGLIHLMGFAKAFDLGDMSQLTQPVSRPAGCRSDRSSTTSGTSRPVSSG